MFKLPKSKLCRLKAPLAEGIERPTLREARVLIDMQAFRGTPLGLQHEFETQPNLGAR